MMFMPALTPPLGPSRDPQTLASLGAPVETQLRFHLTDSVYKVVLQKSIPAQIRQTIL